jgi:hypothetical protein
VCELYFGLYGSSRLCERPRRAGLEAQRPHPRALSDCRTGRHGLVSTGWWLRLVRATGQLGIIGVYVPMNRRTR